MNRTIAIVIGMIVLIGVIGFVSYKNMPHREVITIADTPNMKFLKQKAAECQGDFNKLTPADQQKVREISKGYAAFDMKRYYSASK